MMKKAKICALALTGCLLSTGFVTGNSLAAEPERTGYIPPAHHFLYEDNNTKGNENVAYEGNRMAANTKTDDGGFLGNSIRATERRGYIPPAHYFLYE